MLVFLFIKESPPPPKKKYYAANTILYIDNKHFKIHKNRKQVSFNCENIYLTITVFLSSDDQNMNITVFPKKKKKKV